MKLPREDVPPQFGPLPEKPHSDREASEQHVGDDSHNGEREKNKAHRRKRGFSKATDRNKQGSQKDAPHNASYSERVTKEDGYRISNKSRKGNGSRRNSEKLDARSDKPVSPKRKKPNNHKKPVRLRKSVRRAA